MTHRTKLLILLIGLVAISNGLLAAVNHMMANALLQREIHRKARSIATTASVLLDPEIVKMVRQRGDEDRPEYARVQAQLRQIRDSNRRDDVWIRDIFTLMAAPQNPRIVIYGVDSEERFEYTHHVGDIYKSDGKPVAIGLNGIDKLARDLKNFQAGYESSFAPIKDKSGALVALLGVTLLPAPSSTLRDLDSAIVTPFAITICLAFLLAVWLSRSVTKPLEILRREIESIGQGDLNAAASIPPEMTGEFAQMAAAISTMAAGLRERDTIKHAFSGYISRQVLDSIMAKGGMPELKGERRRITVLFSDIRGFTSMAEGMRPEEVVELLDEFFSRMVDVIVRHQGIIDKFLGDGMMVLFGAPLDDPYQEEHAVLAALEMQKELQALCTKWEAEGRRAIKMGIGINSGPAVVGTIGSMEHMEYTAIGDTVNLASRLESAARDLGLEIVVSENTYSAVRPSFLWKPAGDVTLRGRTEPVRAYTAEGVSENFGQLPH
jgi:adenylate cyclase